MNELIFLTLFILTFANTLECVNIENEGSNGEIQTTQKVARPQSTNSTTVDLPDFNATDDGDFVWKAAKHNSPLQLLKLALIESMRAFKQPEESKSGFKQFYFDLTPEFFNQKIFDEDDLGELIRAFYIPKAEFLARQIRWAIQGIGTDETTLSDIFCCLDPNVVQMHAIRVAYKRLYGTQLANDVEGDVGGIYGDVLKKLIKGNRPVYTLDEDARRIAKKFLDDVDYKLFTDPNPLPGWHYFVTRSYEEIGLVTKYFYEFSGNKIRLSSYLKNATAHTAYSIFSKGFWNIFLYRSPSTVSSNYQDLILDIVLYSEKRLLYKNIMLSVSILASDRKRLTRIVSVHADSSFGLMKEQILNRMGGNSNIVKWFLESLNATEKGDWYAKLVARIIHGNTNLNNDPDWIKIWEDYEASKKPDLPKCWLDAMLVLGQHFEWLNLPFQTANVFYIYFGGGVVIMGLCVGETFNSGFTKSIFDSQFS